jgi:putative ABC transport system permease protein
MWQNLINDARYGVRMLYKYPVFTTIAVLTLAVGIGASATIFSAVHAVLLRPLPYEDPSRLAMLWTDDPRHDIHEEGTSYLNFLDWKKRTQTFEDLAICSRGGSMTLTGEGEAEQVPGEVVSANLFPLLGIAPVLGRTFTTQEADRSDRVVVIGHALWKRRFGASRDVIGKPLAIDGVTWQVIGVMPTSFQFPSRDTELWTTDSTQFNMRRIKAYRFNDWWRVVGRLKATVTIAQAQSEMNTIGRQLAQTYPITDSEFAGYGVNVVPLRDQITGRKARLALWLLFGAVVLVLLIACANVAGLLLARGATRHREIAVRMALGASRVRLIGQLLMESAMLSLSSGALGLLLAFWGVWAVASFGPTNIARLEEVSIDGAVLAFSFVVSVVTGFLFGMAPAWRLSQGDPGRGLKESGRSQSVGPGSRRLRDTLIVGEFAVAVVLLCGAGLLVRSLLRIQAIDPGFRPQGALIARLSISKPRAQEQAFYREALERVAALPGVTAVGLITDAFQRRNPDNPLLIEGHSISTGEAISNDAVSPGYFQAAGTPLLQGRYFTELDRAESTPIAIINQTMARRSWPGENPIGKRFKLAGPESRRPWLTVVGVVGDMRREGLEKQAIAQTFRPSAQQGWGAMDLVARTASDPSKLAPALRAAIHAIDASTPVFEVSTMERRLSELESPRRFQTLLMTLFSAAALLFGGDGNLRPHPPLCCPTDARDRHSHGAGRSIRRRSRDGVAPGARPCADWRRGWCCCRVGADPNHGQPALWSEDNRFGDLRFCACSAAGDRARGVSSPRS